VIILHIVATLLILNIYLTHSARLKDWYYIVYKKLVKPKFKKGELVMINGLEHEIINIIRRAKPYTYFCLLKSKSSAIIHETWFHESLIKKKTGLLKELE